MKTLIGILALCLLSPSDAYRKYPSEPEPPIVCPCQYKYDPVCGSDGITYMNKCVLDCTSAKNTERGQPLITMVQECECSDKCKCQNVDLPVCTLDGKTYPNECELACENIRRIASKQLIVYLAYRTACRGSPGYCTNITAPVCGSDNVLYRNRCVLDYANNYNSELGIPPITVKNTGACQDDYLCPITKQPVCASDGNIYNNPCELEAENERRKCYEETIFLAEADQSTCSDCYCPIDNEPICASDGYTYSNLCQLDCAIQKQNNRNLKAVYKGNCRDCECKEDHQPVCGTDRKTYDSSCLLECENIGRSEELPPLKIFHVGKCQEFACNCSHCDDNSYQPVCGSDGQTYWNRCWLQCNDSCCQTNKLPAVKYSKKGPC